MQQHRQDHPLEYLHPWSWTEDVRGPCGGTRPEGVCLPPLEPGRLLGATPAANGEDLNMIAKAGVKGYDASVGIPS